MAPLAVFVIWRLSEAALVEAFGGAPLGSTFQWDGGWYFSILQHGYANTAGGFKVFQNTAFFPGIVWLTEPLRLVLPDRWAAIVAANLIAAAAFICVFNAVRTHDGDRVARSTIIALALWPSSLFLWAYYSDGLLVAASAGAIWAFKSDKHALGAVAAGAAACTRLVGVLVGPVLATVRVWRRRRVDGTAIAYVASSAIGLGAVALTQGLQARQPLGFLKAQSAWGRGLAPPWQPFLGSKTTILPFRFEASLEACAVVLVGAGVVALVVRSVRRRAPAELSAWAVVAWFVPLLSKIIYSQMRFVLGAWPAFTMSAQGAGRAVRMVRWLGVLLALAVSGVLLYRWAHYKFDG